jgi:hypothetical protein
VKGSLKAIAFFGLVDRDDAHEEKPRGERITSIFVWHFCPNISMDFIPFTILIRYQPMKKTDKEIDVFLS